MKRPVIAIIVVALGVLAVASFNGTRPSTKQRSSTSAEATANQAAESRSARSWFSRTPHLRPAGSAVREPEVTYSALSTSDPVAMPPPKFGDQAVTGPIQETVAPPDSKQARFEEDQDRYLRDVIAPRVRECWRKLEGNGRIEFLYLMRHETGVGVGKVSPTTDIGIETPVSVVTSDLTPEQSRRALDCMLDAVEGTSFTTELPDGDLGNLVGKYQIWTVGKPAEQ
jgi:hypothetical protein